MSAQDKQQVLDTVALTQTRSQWPLDAILRVLGLPRSVYFAWRVRQVLGQLEDQESVSASVDQLLDQEVQDIKSFALSNPRVGYRKLTYMMLDQEVVAVSESATYRVLDGADLLHRWKRSEAAPGLYSLRPTAPNEQWHTDVMYVWVGCRHYFLLSFIDAFSRYIVHHRLLVELNGRSVAIELEAAIGKAGPVTPRIVHDHGSEFCNRDLTAVLKAHDLTQIKTRPRHPESNGLIERFNGTVRDESEDRYGGNYLQAQRTIEELIEHYNHRRLHAALGYIEPWVVHYGDPSQRREERRHKLQAARQRRRAYNRGQKVAQPSSTCTI